MSTPPQATLLIVDDIAQNLTLLGELLYPTYRVLAATSGAKALRMARGTPRPDLILLDVMMPEMNGYETFERLRADPTTCDIPVIFLTALDAPEEELHGLEVGAADYITKPIRPSVVLARVQIQLTVKRARDCLNDQNAWLEAEVARRMAENEQIQTVAIRALAYLAEIRDLETGTHILRTQAFVRLLATRLCQHPGFTPTLDQDYIDLLTRSAPLHDIGKVGIPDAILQKPGSLTAPEWRIMQTHTIIGADAIALAQQGLDRPLAFLALAEEIARWHHERWDGSGYPDGLAGEFGRLGRGVDPGQCPHHESGRCLRRADLAAGLQAGPTLGAGPCDRRRRARHPVRSGGDRRLPGWFRGLRRHCRGASAPAGPVVELTVGKTANPSDLVASHRHRGLGFTRPVSPAAVAADHA